MSKTCYAVIIAFFVLIAAIGLCTLIDGAIVYWNRPVMEDYVRGGVLTAQSGLPNWLEEG